MRRGDGLPGIVVISITKARHRHGRSRENRRYGTVMHAPRGSAVTTADQVTLYNKEKADLAATHLWALNLYLQSRSDELSSILRIHPKAIATPSPWRTVIWRPILPHSSPL